MQRNSARVRGRFAPSPSGRMHVGNLLSGLLAWLSARSQGGEFVIRLEQLDERCKDEYALQVLDDLAWLGIDWDEEPFVQKASDKERFDEAFETLASVGRVYPCFCSRADLHAASAPHASDGTVLYAGTCRGLDSQQVALKDAEIRKRTGHGPAWRLEVPDTDIVFEDAVQGIQRYNLVRDSGDFVVRRSDGVYAYQLAVVVDDAACAATEVVRGSDLLSSVPRQRYLQELLGLPPVRYAHHPLILAPDGRRLSKRDKDCDVGVIRSRVGSAEELVGRLAYLAGFVDAEEAVSALELVDDFSWEKINSEDIKLTPCADFF